ncbi:MAG TPA: nucleotidyltransferase family protein [Rhodoblastus sp.]|nr:nucleotidyltransferase family protein [Rhodoblastus sp.]
MVEVAAIVLAAGRSTRFSGGADGVTKLAAELDGAPLVRHAVEAATGCGTRPVVVVTGHARDRVVAALAGLSIVEAPNPDFASGIASSVRTGLAALNESVDGALVFLGDMPRVTAALARRLIDAFAADPQLDAVAPLVEGRRGNPILLSRRLFAAAMKLEGDEGARRILMRPDLRIAEVAIDDDGAAIDVDTPEALHFLGKGSGG